MEIITISSIYPEHAALYNYASQAWNTNFFLQQLTEKHHEPNMIVKQSFAAQFGSLEGFKNTFKAHALGIFGNGWTWLALDKDGKLYIKNTYNGGSLFSMLPSNSKGLLGVGNEEVLNIAVKRSEGRNSSVANVGNINSVVPLLGLNMWMDAYLPDFGYDREAYIESFWKVVNWDQLSQKLYKKE
ncbi:hypothetical protein BB559_000475 [Furculomyces boomerangus]|uniref:Manganese/iron superoxide dismutase C-terminal domain-containing protein n=2 Tax=Harpellales TaxID=61421 RepID=A0A2T9Z5A3_9FUNG|nr:hypothetical protein BB559_004976 [Furculomyces boomerangus]PVU99726.1 hypothetical protein BB559_000475 [Furculomyces boomerangus]